MEEKKDQELKVEKKENTQSKEKKKTEWSVKKVITTVIIAILALLMIGGMYYIVLLVQQETDDTNVFGKFNGEPIRYEAGSIFYNTLNSNATYQSAAEAGDLQAIYQAWYQAYQSQVIYTALKQYADAAGVRTPSSLVDKLLVRSGLYASEDGSKTFDEEVYKATSPVDRTATYQYYTKIYPYVVAMNDIQLGKTSDAEMDFIAELSKDTRSFDYYVVDFNAYPDDLAQAYDISEMKVEEGKEPSLEEIKAYIFSKEPDTVKPFIEEAVAQAVLEDFDAAAEEFQKVSMENVVANIGDSTFMFNSVSNKDIGGYLSSAMTEDLAKELYAAEEGYTTSPISVNDAYIVVKVTSATPSDGASSTIKALYPMYTPSISSNNFAGSFMYSDKFEDNFMNKIFPLLFGGQLSFAN